MTLSYVHVFSHDSLSPSFLLDSLLVIYCIMFLHEHSWILKCFHFSYLFFPPMIHLYKYMILSHSFLFSKFFFSHNWSTFYKLQCFCQMNLLFAACFNFFYHIITFHSIKKCTHAYFSANSYIIPRLHMNCMIFSPTRGSCFAVILHFVYTWSACSYAYVENVASCC